MLTLIDGNSLLYRAFYGVSGRLTRDDGTPVNAVFGFCNLLLPLLANAKDGDCFMCIFDESRKTFRNEIYDNYKANRAPAPEELRVQIPIVRDAVRAMGIPVFAVPGVEADDVIATLSHRNCANHNQTRIVSSDKDLMQLVSDCVFLYDGMKDVEIREPQVIEKFGVKPNQVIDVQSLMGDSSDNVPGVPGIGPKKAAELINEFGDLNNLYNNLDKIKNERIKNLLNENQEMALISRRLVTLRTDCDLPEISCGTFLFDRERFIKFATDEIQSPTLATKAKNLFQDSNPISNPQSPIPNLQSPISNLASLKTFLANVKDVIAIDTETTGLNSMTDTVVGISLATDSKNGIYIPIAHGTVATDLFGENTFDSRNMDINIVRELLTPIFENPNIIKVAHNFKFDLHMLENSGFNAKKIEPIADTMLMSYVLNGSRHSHSLDELARDFLGVDTIKFESLGTKDFASVDIEIAAKYAAEDAYVCFALYKLFEPKITNVYTDIDLPLLKVLWQIERNGVLINRARLSELSVIFHKKMNTIAKRIFATAGHEFNIASPKQIAVVLFDELGLESNKKRSTDSDALEQLADVHDIASDILEWRSIAKLAGTYADALPQLICSDGKIHTTYLQTSTNTGRLSSRNPNLQNIPIRTELGAEIRKCFIAEPGRVLISADYSQMQLRLLADIADVAAFKDAFNNNRDIHCDTARKIFDIARDQDVPRDMRYKAKTVNFSIVYGISNFGLANQLNMSRVDAQKLIDSYMNNLPEIKKYMRDTSEFAMANARVVSPMGRNIELPEIKNPRLKSYALRAAVNAPIQGAEADIVRIAMKKLSDMLTEDIKMIMQVHDEIVFECDEKTADSWAEKIRNTMENVVKLSVPLPAETVIATEWEH